MGELASRIEGRPGFVGRHWRYETTGPTNAWTRWVLEFKSDHGMGKLMVEDMDAPTLEAFKGLITRGLVADMWQARNWHNQLVAKGIL